MMGERFSLRDRLLSLSEENTEEDSEGEDDAVGVRPRSLTERTSLDSWVCSFRKLDPRWQIRKFFDDVSAFGDAAIFTVWRPTSADAIAKMMNGDGVGKGLDIKGKSAKRGILSGYVPFLQIHEEEHRKEIRVIAKGDRTKIFFRSRRARDEVGERLGAVAKDLSLRVARAKFALARAKFGCDANAVLREGFDYAAHALSHEIENPRVVRNDDYAPGMYGLEVSCRVLWAGLVEGGDISRRPGSDLDTGRPSQPAYQDMNFAALRRREASEPLPVLCQRCEDDPFDARTLVMAYEEEGRVVPVVSDFDCLLIGTRNFRYEDPMPPEQVELLGWCVSSVERILERGCGPESWTARWLEVLKGAARNGFYPKMPRFGFGDPTSYSMIEASVRRTARSGGAVRHGPECFNFFFPQEIDDKFLIIFPGGERWKYVGEEELVGILRGKIREGFTFPLNPKWLLCDPGWISLFRDLLDSDRPGVRESLDLWFPPESGLRERILDISLRFPNGFCREDRVYMCPSMAMDEYERYLTWQRARLKMRGVAYWKDLLRDVRRRAESSVDDHCRDAAEGLDFLGDTGRRRLSLLAETDDIEDETIKEIRMFDFFDGNAGGDAEGAGNGEVDLSRQDSESVLR